MSAGTLRARKSKSLSAGVQGPLNGPGSSIGFINALSRHLRLIFKHSDTKWDKKNIVDPFFFGGGGHLLRPPLDKGLYISNLLYSWLFIDPSGHHNPTQISKFTNLF